MSHESLTAEDVSAAIPSRAWRPAVLASVLFHLLILIALLQLRFGAANAALAFTSQRHVVAVKLRPPPVDKQESSSAVGPALPNAPADTTGSVSQSAAPVGNLAPASRVETNRDSTPSTIATIPQGLNTLTQDDIRRSIAKFSAEFKSELTADWISDCLSFRERYPTRECPQQQAQETPALDESSQIASTVFAGVTRDDRHKRLTNSFLQENERLQDLMEEGGVLGSLARERYYLNREYVFYLNGNFNFGAWNFVKTSNASNGNLEFMRSFMQFQCKESPCIYEFTGIGAKPADGSADAKAEASNSDAFGPRRR